MTSNLPIVLTLFAVILSGVACANKPANNNLPPIESRDLFQVCDDLGTETPVNGGSVIRSRGVKVNADLLSEKMKVGAIRNLNLNFFEDAKFRVERKKQTSNEVSGNITWLGVMPSKPKSLGIFVVSEKRIDGSLDVPGIGLFTVEKLSAECHVVKEVNRSATLDY